MNRLIRWHIRWLRMQESSVAAVQSGEVLASASPDTSIHIQVNGELQTAPCGSTVAGLLQQLDIRSDRVAVEVNLQIVDRQNFDRQSLQEGDRIEILSFIGGGAEW